MSNKKTDDRIGPTPERLAKAPAGTVDLVETVGRGTTKRAGVRIITPLDELRYNDRITEKEYEAGQLYYVDYYFAERPSQGTMKWRDLVSGGHAPEELDGAERAAFHSRRFHEANQTLGPYQGAVARMLLVEDMSCFQIGVSLHGYKHANSASAAGVVLATTVLDTLSRFYKL